MNTQLLNDIADQIEEHPHAFDQTTFGLLTGEFQDNDRDDSEVGWDVGWYEQDVVCDTPCCVAGWTILLTETKLKNNEDIEKVARDLLGIPSAWCDRLFAESWPVRWFSEEVQEEYSEADKLSLRRYPSAREAADVLRRIASGALASLCDE